MARALPHVEQHAHGRPDGHVRVALCGDPDPLQGRAAHPRRHRVPARQRASRWSARFLFGPGGGLGRGVRQPDRRLLRRASARATSSASSATCSTVSCRTRVWEALTDARAGAAPGRPGIGRPRSAVIALAATLCATVVGWGLQLLGFHPVHGARHDRPGEQPGRRGRRSAPLLLAVLYPRVRARAPALPRPARPARRAAARGGRSLGVDAASSAARWARSSPAQLIASGRWLRPGRRAATREPARARSASGSCRSSPSRSPGSRSCERAAAVAVVARPRAAPTRTATRAGARGARLRPAPRARSSSSWARPAPASRRSPAVSRASSRASRRPT